MATQSVDFDSAARQAFRLYLRTGRRSPAGAVLEFKFNPYHDPRNGQFTFAPGGPRSLRDILVSPRHHSPALPGGPTGRGGRRSRGNIESFYDPATLERVFPGLASAPAGAIVSFVDPFLDITGPANAMTAEFTHRIARDLIGRIKKVDPTMSSKAWVSPEP